MRLGAAYAGIGFFPIVQIDFTVAAVDFEHGSDEHDDVFADLVDHGRIFHGEAIGELHEHFRRTCFGGMNRAREPVEGFAGFLEVRGFVRREFARVGEFRGDVLVMVELRDVLRVADGHDHEVAALLAFAGNERADAGRGFFESAVITIDVGDMRQLVWRADGVAENFVGRRNGLRRRKVVNERSGEIRLGGVLADLRGVVRVERLSGRLSVRAGLFRMLRSLRAGRRDRQHESYDKNPFAASHTQKIMLCDHDESPSLSLCRDGLCNFWVSRGSFLRGIRDEAHRTRGAAGCRRLSSFMMVHIVARCSALSFALCARRTSSWVSKAFSECVSFTRG